jgi:hypothetical protein
MSNDVSLTPGNLLRELSGRQVRVIENGDRRPVLRFPSSVPDDRLVAACRKHAWLFTWGIEGARTGHGWHVCDGCGNIQLLRSRSGDRVCSLTFGCQGQMRRVNITIIPGEIIRTGGPAGP